MKSTICSLILFIILIYTVSVSSAQDIAKIPLQTITLVDKLLPDIEGVVQNCDRAKGKILREKIGDLLYGSIWKDHIHKDPYSKCHKLLSSLEQATYIALPDYGLNYINSTGYLDNSYAECRKAAYPHETLQEYDGNMHWSNKLGDEPKKAHCFIHPEFIEEKNNAKRFVEEWVSLIDQQEYEEAFQHIEGILYKELFNKKITFEVWNGKLIKSREKIEGPFKRQHDKLSYGSKENQLNNDGKGVFKFNRFTIANKLLFSKNEKILTETIMIVEVDGVLRVESYSIR